MIDLGVVGARVSEAGGEHSVDMGIYLPGVRPDDGYELTVKVIHEKDQFTPGIEPAEYKLGWAGGDYDLWKKTINISAAPRGNGQFGRPGRYYYRFQLSRNGKIVTFWFADPFARQSGPGKLSAFEVGTNGAFTWEDDGFKVPPVEDLVVYETMVGEFNENINGITAMLDYIQGLGVNAIELMPVTNVQEPFRWGYMPLSHMAPDERYGTSSDMKNLVNECHKKGMAVILDAVYAHAHRDFAYDVVFHSTGLPNPMMGLFAEEMFGVGTDFNKAFTSEYFRQVNRYWLDEYHVDGFRYDYVPGYYAGPDKPGYASLVYDTYQYSKTLPRFQCPEGYSRIIQCAENIPNPKGMLRETYSNSCWQNSLLDKAEDMAEYKYVDDNFPLLLDLRFNEYPEKYINPANGEEFPVSAFQYIESHDHSRLITKVAKGGMSDPYGQPYGDRRLWFKLQPFVIALYTCQGVPMLWQGQEFAENYSVPGGGWERVLVRRPLHWEYFYDEAGKSLMWLYRRMGGMRRDCRALRSRNSFFYNRHSSTQTGVVVYSREAPSENGSAAQKALVFLNFSDYDRYVMFPFPEAGAWRERLIGNDVINVSSAGEEHNVTVTSNYGKVFLLG